MSEGEGVEQIQSREQNEVGEVRRLGAWWHTSVWIQYYYNPSKTFWDSCVKNI